jgi:hypothetical protein
MEPRAAPSIRPPSRSAFSSFIAPATDKPAKPEFVSRGAGQFKTNGVALIRADGHYRLAPLAVAAAAPVDLVMPDD